MAENRDQFQKYMQIMGRLITANEERHNDAEKCMRMCMGGKHQWEEAVYDGLDAAGMPVISDNQIQRNISLHAGYYLRNMWDFRWEGDNSNLDAPIELANLYHYHVRNINYKDFVDLMVYTLGCIFEGAWLYSWEMGNDGAKDIGVTYRSILGMYPDPQVLTHDWGGPDAAILGFKKFVRYEDVAEEFPEFAEKIKDQLKQVKAKGYEYDSDFLRQDEHLRARAGDFYDEVNGMPALCEIWDYERERKLFVADAETNRLFRAPKTEAARKLFMMRPGASDRYTYIEKKVKVLYRRMFMPLIEDTMLLEEAHDIQPMTADGKNRMPVVPFSALITNDEPKGFVKDSIGLQEMHNKLTSSHLHTAITNAAPNRFHSAEDYESVEEAERYEEDAALPGQRPYRMKKGRVNPPQVEQPNPMDAESHKLNDAAPAMIRDSMQMSDVIAGVQEKEETLGQFEGRQEAALIALGPTNSIWTHAQIKCADIEWSMMRELGEEKIERIIDARPSSDVFKDDDEVIVNMQLEGGLSEHNLAEIERGKVTPIQVQFSSSHKSYVTGMLMKIIQGIPDPRVANALLPSLFKQFPLPREEREKVVAALDGIIADRNADIQGGINPDATPKAGGNAMPVGPAQAAMA